MSLTLTSPAFQHNGEIPARFTCEGDDIAPELSWDLHHPTKAKLEGAMDGHVLARTELIGTYEKSKKTLLGSLFGR